MRFLIYAINKQTKGWRWGYRIQDNESQHSIEVKQINSQDDIFKNCLNYNCKADPKTTQSNKLEGSGNYLFRGENGTLKYLTV